MSAAVAVCVVARGAETVVDGPGVIIATVLVPPVHVGLVNENYRHINVF